jgi:hypothetical protein
MRATGPTKQEMSAPILAMRAGLPVYIPPPPPKVVVRPRLIERLCYSWCPATHCIRGWKVGSTRIALWNFDEETYNENR